MTYKRIKATQIAKNTHYKNLLSVQHEESKFRGNETRPNYCCFHESALKINWIPNKMNLSTSTALINYPDTREFHFVFGNEKGQKDVP